MADIHSSNRFTIRRKIFQLLGASFEVLDENEELVMFASQKAFKLREDIRLYAEREKLTELVTIKARNIIDFSATYDVVDAKTGENLGAFKRNGLKSMLKDEWTIFDASGAEVAKVHEDSQLMAILRRFLSNLIPQTYHVYNNEKEAFAVLNRNFNPFVSKINIDFSYGAEQQLDKRVGLALAVLLNAIDGKQQ